MSGRIKWILDADIQGCFDNFDHKILRELLSRRIKDRSILRLVDLWLKVGTTDGKSLHRNTVGTPQGNIVSPLLCNVYLHYLLDEWVERTIRPLLKGKIFIIRYADDFIIGFEKEEDAIKVSKVLPKWMQKYGLTIHPEKSQLIKFVPEEKGGSPTFDFLGFTHYWTKSQKGYNVVKRHTGNKKMRKAIQNIRECCKVNRHKRLIDQYKLLSSKLRGLYQYYGIRGNFIAIKKMYLDVKYTWYKWLNRRSQLNIYTWKGYGDLLKNFVLPRPRIVHLNCKGYSNVHEKIRFTPQTRMLIASVSKTMAVTAIMQLNEKGLVLLDEDINSYLPFSVRNPSFPDDKITVKMLLTHTSSISDGGYPMVYYLFGYVDYPESLMDFEKNYLTKKGRHYTDMNFLKVKPGNISSYSYSNVAAALLACLVEYVSGTDYNTYCKTNIFEPLGMTRTTWFFSETPKE